MPGHGAVDGIAERVRMETLDIGPLSVTSGADLVLFAQDAGNYSEGSIHITSIGIGNTVIVEQSNDGTNWAQIFLQSGVGGGATGTITSTGIWYFPIFARYVRARVSVYGSGTVTVRAHFKSTAPPLFSLSTLANLALSASESHIGEVGGNSDVVIITPTVGPNVQYTAGDSIGGKLVLTGFARASLKGTVLQSLHIADNGNQKPTGQLLFFNADPTNATLTDNSPFAYGTDWSKQIGRLPITADLWTSVNSKASLQLNNIGMVLKPLTGTTLWAAFVCDNTPTIPNVGDLVFAFGPLKD